MNSTKLYNLFRNDVTDTVKPYLWSDPEVFTYMGDAYDMFVRLTGGIPDFTSPVTQLVAKEGVATTKVSEKILRFVHAWRVADMRELAIINSTDLGRTFASDYGSWNPQRLTADEGPITSMLIGMERNKVRWLKVPASDQAVQLHVYRLPLERITDFDQELEEVDEIHHLHLLKWMKSLAYRKQDAETLDVGTADQNELLFRNYCFEAKAEFARRDHKTRIVQYNGL